MIQNVFVDKRDLHMESSRPGCSTGLPAIAGNILFQSYAKLIHLITFEM